MRRTLWPQLRASPARTASGRGLQSSCSTTSQTTPTSPRVRSDNQRFESHVHNVPGHGQDARDAVVNHEPSAFGDARHFVRVARLVILLYISASRPQRERKNERTSVSDDEISQLNRLAHHTVNALTYSCEANRLAVVADNRTTETKKNGQTNMFVQPLALIRWQTHTQEHSEKAHLSPTLDV